MPDVPFLCAVVQACKTIPQLKYIEIPPYYHCSLINYSYYLFAISAIIDSSTNIEVFEYFR